MTPLLRTLRNVFGALLLVTLLAAAFVAFIATTESGARLALDRAVLWSGQNLAYESVHGRLVESLELRGLRFENAGARVEAEVVTLRWRPLSLLDGLLRVDYIRVRGADVSMQAAAAASPPVAPSYPALPLRLRLDEMLLDGFTLVRGDTRQTFERVRFELRADHREFRIDTYEVKLPGHAIDGAAAIANARPLAIDAHAAWNGTLAGRDGTARVTIAGPLERLQLEGEFAAAQTGSFTARVNAAAVVPQFSARVDLAPFDVPAAEAPVQIGASRIEVSGTANAVDLDLVSSLARTGFARREVTAAFHVVREPDAARKFRATFRWSASAAGTAPAAGLGGEGEFRLDETTLRFRHVGAAPFPVTLEGELAAPFDAPRIDVTARWPEMSLPVPEREPLPLEPGEVHLAGTLPDLAVSGAVAAVVQPAGRLEARWHGRLSSERFAIEQATVHLLGGQLELAGAVDFQPALSGAFSLAGRDLDLAALRPDLTTRLDLSGEGSFRAVEAGIETRVVLSKATGDWRGFRFTATADLEAKPGSLNVRAAELALGDNTARVAGTLAEEALDGSFSLDFNDLAQFAAGLRGRVSASGSAGGSPSTPALDLVFDGRDLAYEAWSAPGVSGQAKLDFGREAASRVRLDVGTIRRGSTTLGELALSLDGTTGAHVIALTFDAPARRARLEAEGGWQDSGWSGRLTALRLTLGTLGEWSLADAATLSVRDRVLDVAPVCLLAQQARACARVRQWSGTDGTADVELVQVPLDLAADYLPATIAIEGTADLRATVERSEGALNATGAAAVPAGRVRLATEREDEAQAETIDIRGVHLDFEVNPELARVSAHADVSDWFALDAELSYGLGGEHAIDGTLAARSANLAWVGEFVPAIAGTSGAAEVSGRFGGTLAEPRISLDARLSGGVIHVPESGTRISQLEAKLSSPAGRRLMIEIRAREDAGTLDVDGEIALSGESGWPGTLQIRGDRFPIVRLPDAEADASPELAVDFSATRLDLKGKIVLPRVEVDVIALPESAVSVSADEVIVGPGTDGSETNGGRRRDFFTDAVTGDIELVLGDEVAINAAGLSARMTGGLRWTKDRGDAIGRGAGRISIAEGSYTAYNQNLSIERGRLLFTGAIDNPSLDVRAVRPDLDVVAGVRVTGYMTAPEFRLFSQPAMPDGEILSYIITGHGLTDASSGEAGVIAQAALSLGSERSSIVTSQVQHAFGLDEFSVNTGTTARETSLVAGKRLTPKLSVRSDFNPFDQLWSFFLNYKLTQTWSVEAESGHRQGADLIYSIERDDLIPNRWFE